MTKQLFLAIKTDEKIASIELHDENKTLKQKHWEAHKELSNTLLLEIEALLSENASTFQDLTGVAVYKGPGSFTGLRIGITAANTLASGLKVPIVAGTGSDWITQSVDALVSGQDEKIIIPEYGAEPNITKPRK